MNKNDIIIRTWKKDSGGETDIAIVNYIYKKKASPYSQYLSDEEYLHFYNFFRIYKNGRIENYSNSKNAMQLFSQDSRFEFSFRVATRLEIDKLIPKIINWQLKKILEDKHFSRLDKVTVVIL